MPSAHFDYVLGRATNGCVTRKIPCLRAWLCPLKSYNFIWRDIEVVITGLTRNQFVSNHTRVRIPLSPPNKKDTPCGCPFYLAQSVGREPCAVWREGSVVRRRAPPACRAAARRDAFERKREPPDLCATTPTPNQ